MNTPIVNSGIRLFVSALDREQQQRAPRSRARRSRPVDGPLGAQVEDVRHPVVLGEQAHQHRQAAEARVRRERRARARPRGSRRRTASRCRTRRPSPARAPSRRPAATTWWARIRMPSPTSITPSSDAERDLGALGGARPWLAERRHAVGDRLDAGDGRAAGRERLENQHDPKRLRDRRGTVGVPIVATAGAGGANPTAITARMLTMNTNVGEHEQPAPTR